METYSTDRVQIHHTDHFRFVADGSVDMVLTDPPFNIARETNFHTYEGNTINSFKFDGKKGWDSNPPEAFRGLLKSWSREFARVLKTGGSFAIFCADEYLSDLIGALRDAGLKPRRTVTWRKPNAVPVNRRHMMMSACEYIIVGVKGGRATFNADIVTRQDERYHETEIINIADKIASVLELEIRKSLEAQTHRLDENELHEAVKNVLEFQVKAAVTRASKIHVEHGLTSLCVPNYVSFNSKSGNRLHPTEKPVSLLTYLLDLFSNENDLVLDPFSGSGSTGEATLLRHRRAILVERDDEFFSTSVNRIAHVVNSAQQKLFP